MTKEIRSPNVEGRSGVQSPVRHSDFGIPSDFVIRYSGLRISVHGEPPFALRMHWDHEPLRPRARRPRPRIQATQSRTRSRTTARTKGRFMESPDGSLTAHGDHEPVVE